MTSQRPEIEGVVLVSWYGTDHEPIALIPPPASQAHLPGSISTSFLSNRHQTNCVSCPSISAAQRAWLTRMAATAHPAFAPAPEASGGP